jgi:hypothetical protein
MSQLSRCSQAALLTRRMVCCWLAVGLLAAARGDEAPTSAAQLQRMQQRVTSLRLQRGAQPVEVVETAILRYSSPGGIDTTTDGAVWVWGRTGRPAALSAIFFEQLPTGEEKWSCELTALADEPLVLVAKPGWKWTPLKSELRWTPFPGAAAVGETANQRTRQLKDLAREFSASETFDASHTDQLRLLIQPLHRYTDPAQDVLDGALFGFAAGTNPEAMLLLEARRDARGMAAWHFAFARMGAASAQARLHDKVVWECPAIHEWRDREPYFSNFGKDAAVFGELSR